MAKKTKTKKEVKKTKEGKVGKAAKAAKVAAKKAVPAKAKKASKKTAGVKAAKKTAKDIKKTLKKSEKTVKTVTFPELKVDRRREWRFELPLQAEVEGKLPNGKKFKEEVMLENISSGGAYFCLDSGVVVGSKLNLVIDVPSELSEGKKLKLSLGGLTIRLEKPPKKGKKQGVALRFQKKFKFISESDEEEE